LEKDGRPETESESFPLTWWDTDLTTSVLLRWSFLRSLTLKLQRQRAAEAYGEWLGESVWTKPMAADDWTD